VTHCRNKGERAAAAPAPLQGPRPRTRGSIMGRAASPRRTRMPVFFFVSGFACVSLPTAWIFFLSL
jgi:hypothetical protein